MFVIGTMMYFLNKLYDLDLEKLISEDADRNGTYL